MYRTQSHKSQASLISIIKQEIRLSSHITGFSTTLKTSTLSNSFLVFFPNAPNAQYTNALHNIVLLKLRKSAGRVLTCRC